MSSEDEDEEMPEVGFYPRQYWWDFLSVSSIESLLCTELRSKLGREKYQMNKDSCTDLGEQQCSRGDGAPMSNHRRQISANLFTVNSHHVNLRWLCSQT